MKKTSITLRITGLLILLSSIVSVTNAQEVTVTAPTDQRTIIGGGDTRTFDYTVTEADDSGTGQTVTYTPTNAALDGSTVGIPSSGNVLGENTSTTVTVTPDYANFNFGANTVGLTVSEDDPTPWSSVSNSFNVQGIVNRVLTGTYTSNAVSGRFMTGIELGTIVVNSGAWSHDEATDIQIHQTGFIQSENGLRIESTSDKTFNSANDTHTLSVTFNGTGDFNIQNFKLGTVDRQEDDNGKHVSFGGNETIEAIYSDAVGRESTNNVSLLSDLPNSWSDTQGNYDSFRNIEQHNLRPGDPGYLDEIPEGVFGSTGAGPSPINDFYFKEETSRLRENALITGENLQGSELNLSGIAGASGITESGTVLQDRAIFAKESTDNQIDGDDHLVEIGRAMHNASGGIVTESNLSGTVSIRTEGNDNTHTRLKINVFTDVENGVEANLSTEVDFNAGGSNAAVDISAASLTFDSSVWGRQERTVQIGDNIATLENGGVGLTNQSVQNDLEVGFAKTFVKNNTVTLSGGGTKRLYAIEGTSVNDTGIEGLDGASIQENDFTKYTRPIITTSTISVNGTAGSAGTITELANEFTHSVQAEGLTGESLNITGSASSTIVELESVRDANLVHSDTSLVYGVGDSLTFANDNGGITSTKQASIRLKKADSANKTPLFIDNPGSLLSGASNTSGIGVRNVDMGTLGRLYRDEITLTFETYGEFSDSGVTSMGGLYGTRQQNVTYTLEHTSTANSSGTNGGAATISAGSSLREQGVFYTYDDGSVGTTLAILDSETLVSGGGVSLEVANLSSLGLDLQNAKNSNKIVGQVFDINGLNGILHVLEMSYDEAELPYSESSVKIGWYNDAGEWMHSIMGNSDVGIMPENEYSSGKFFSGSYQDYLTSISFSPPQLGAYGVDTTENKAWAVIDHNSSFAVIPEINSLWMLAIAFGGLLTVQQIKNRKKMRRG